MSYCWRLQYYCKLGAAHRVGPIYYVSRLPQQAHQFRNQLRVPALPRVSTGGHTRSGYDITLCATGKRDGKPPVQAGRGAQGLSLCQAVSSGWADGWRHQAGGDGSGVTLSCDMHPHDLFQAHAVVQEVRLEICAQSSSSAMTSLPRC